MQLPALRPKLEEAAAAAHTGGFVDQLALVTHLESDPIVLGAVEQGRFPIDLGNRNSSGQAAGGDVVHFGQNSGCRTATYAGAAA